MLEVGVSIPPVTDTVELRDVGGWSPPCGGVRAGTQALTPVFFSENGPCVSLLNPWYSHKNYHPFELGNLLEARFSTERQTQDMSSRKLSSLLPLGQAQQARV